MYDQRGEPVRPDTPNSILPFDDALPRNRLGLAKWLTGQRNPLTARVAVNRYWKLFFGRGLVETPEDFGSQGQRPVHPELLDYLAGWFMENDWSVQALCRKIVLSAAYQQTSEASPELREIDPHNRLLARGPRHRLQAEIIRDHALASSGLLVRTVGGPSVKPYQPPGLWKDAGSLTYEADKGDGLYRRSMYTFMKRTVPHPALTTFDATSREVCIVQRERTQTPLQALILMNDPQYVEAARVLAAKALTDHHGNPERLIGAIFEKLIIRKPDAYERQILLAAFEEQLAAFGQSKESAVQYLATGDWPSDAQHPPEQLAAAAAVTQLIMNFHEFQVKR